MAKTLKVSAETLNKPVSQTELLDGLRARLEAEAPELFAKLTKADVKALYSNLLAEVVDLVNSGRRVALKDIGTFGSRYRAPRSFRNPFAEGLINAEETSVLTFSGSKALKTKLAENKNLTKAHKEAAKAKAKAKK